MEVVLYDKRKHFPFIYGWWKEQLGETLYPELLPDSGAVVFDKDTPLYAAWIYLTNSKASFLAMAVSNPTVSKRRRAKAIGLATLFLEALAKRHGCKFIVGISGHPSLSRRMKRNGFKDMGEHFFGMKATAPELETYDRS